MGELRLLLPLVPALTFWIEENFLVKYICFIPVYWDVTEQIIY